MNRINIAIIVVALGLAIILYGFIKNSELTRKPPVNGGLRNDVYCAQDVKQCPDGSYVSRQPSDNCNFAICPI